MFEIYRDTTVGRGYRVVYFTDLDEHNKEKEINDAMRGDHIYDGYLRNFTKEQAKLAVNRILERMNSGDKLTPAEIESELKPFLA
jgi:hypothetical protein